MNVEEAKPARRAKRIKYRHRLSDAISFSSWTNTRAFWNNSVETGFVVHPIFSIPNPSSKPPEPPSPKPSPALLYPIPVVASHLPPVHRRLRCQTSPPPPIAHTRGRGKSEGGEGDCGGGLSGSGVR
ncbi:hypothetical protein Acr_13g0004500 [Actinidia rufa]|uniref:Uncharacterized protein n=1 Tax=Actinidia rufa TaxID=165716 RepID=A0A7J0FLJ1_9ERIC|nr:hypothetical protein Acr_13g0004500 [Actinidia rufa]